MSSMITQLRPSISPITCMTSETLAAGRRLSMMARSQPSCLASARARTTPPTSGLTTTQVAVVLALQVGQQHRAGVDVVDRDVEEALDLVGVQVHRQHALDADRLQQVGHHLGADRHARAARAAVLAGVAEVGDHGGDAACAGALERIDHDQQFHQVLVRRRAGRLHDEDVAGAHVLADLDRDLAVGEAADRRLAELDAQVAGDLLRQRRVGVAGEEHGVEQHAGTLRRLESGPVQQDRIWQGRKDSNPRMSESKSDALTNLATPLHRTRREPAP